MPGEKTNAHLGTEYLKEIPNAEERIHASLRATSSRPTTRSSFHQTTLPAAS